MRLACVALVVLALAASARADDAKDDAKPLEDRRVGLVVQGGGSLRARVEDHLAERLKRDGYTPIEDALGTQALNTLANCFILEDLACARGVVEARAKAPRLVFARIDDTTGAVTLDITWFSRGHAPIAAKTSCSRCNVTWQEHIDDLFAKLAFQADMPLVTGEPEPELEHRPRKKRSKLLSYSLIGAGAATLITGSVLLYYGLRDGASHKYVYPSLTPVGITLIAVGGGAVIGGIITW